jgi:hypothetical protein
MSADKWEPPVGASKIELQKKIPDTIFTFKASLPANGAVMNEHGRVAPSVGAGKVGQLEERLPNSLFRF